MIFRVLRNTTNEKLRVLCEDRSNLMGTLRQLEVKSVLNPCEDDNDDNNDESVSLGVDSQRDDTSESGSEIGNNLIKKIPWFLNEVRTQRTHRTQQKMNNYQAESRTRSSLTNLKLWNLLTCLQISLTFHWY